MTKTILLVDDNPRLLSGARLALEMNGYQVLIASNGKEAIRIMETTRPDMIVSDILMPGCDGFTLIEEVHSRPEWVTIPFLFLSALDNPTSIDRARALGADDYLVKPFSPVSLVQAVRGHIDRAAAIQDANFSKAYLETLLVLANAIEARDLYTGKHTERVADYAQRLAQTLGWSNRQVDDVHRAAILHDVGKVVIPDAILNKPGKLSPQEWEIMKSHTVRGVEILSPLDRMPIVLDGVRHHHEYYDGHGYPDGLAGEGIPAIGRLLAIVDAYDAMTSDRPYRKGLPQDEAVRRLQNGAGSQFDPQFTQAFIRLLRSSSVTQ
ncbi:MAG TPA: HD domain-containing phosphohydrolase [Anaerolineaceae bacterium]|nr:HD domain-containing phosphohydrolase [Anaerolineaceae bacterium]